MSWSDDPITTTLEKLDLVWCVRNLPEEVLKALKENPGRLFLTGGHIRARVANERVNDIDLIAATPELAAKVALELQGRAPAKKTDNAYTLTRFRPVVQVIHRWTYPDPASCLKEFDYTIACAAIWWEEGNWHSLVHPRFYADLAAKRLVYLAPVRHEDAGGSLLRLLKFYQRGYRAPLDTVGAVVARLVKGVNFEHPGSLANDGEAGLALVLTGLLREVDPLLAPDHAAHLPSEKGLEVEEESGIPDWAIGYIAGAYDGHQISLDSAAEVHAHLTKSRLHAQPWMPELQDLTEEGFQQLVERVMQYRAGIGLTDRKPIT